MPGLNDKSAAPMPNPQPLPPSYASAMEPSAPPLELEPNYDLLADEAPPSYSDCHIDYLADIAPPAYEEKSNEERLKQEVKVTDKEIAEWWNRLTYQQQKAIADGYLDLMKRNDEEVKQLKKELKAVAKEVRKNNAANHNITINNNYYDAAPAYCYGVSSYRPYYLRSYYSVYTYRHNYYHRHDDLLDSLIAINLIESAAYLAPYAIQGVFQMMKGMAHLGVGFFKCIGQGIHCMMGGDNASDDAKKLAIFLVALAAIAAAASAAFVVAAYTAKKIAKSIQNIVTLKFDKMISSFIRLGAATGGVALGTLKGAIVGGIIGSAIPGIGNAAGAIIGAVLGAVFTAGIFVVAAKQAMRLASYIVYHFGYYDGINNSTREVAYDINGNPKIEKTVENILSTTNPNKYRFNDAVLEAAKIEDKNAAFRAKAQAEGQAAYYPVVANGTTADLMDTMRSAKMQKTKDWKASFPLTQASEDKEEYNKLIKALREGKASKSRSFDTGKTIFFWSPDNGAPNNGSWQSAVSYSASASRARMR